MIILPLKYITDVLNEDQLEFLAKRLPQPKANTGRPAYTNQELLPGILKVLRSGSRWRDLDRKDLPAGTTHWRRLRYWQRLGGFDDLWEYLLKILLKKKRLKPKVTSIDGTLIPSFNFKELTSYSGKHHRTGTKVSLAVDCLGVPLSKILAVGSAHDYPLAQPTIENIPESIKGQIQKMLADKGYDNSHMRAYLVSLGINPDIPEKEAYVTWREKINLMAQGRYQLKGQSSNRQRFVVERTNAWTKSFRRLRFRYDFSLLSFTAFLNLAFVVICIRKLIP